MRVLKRVLKRVLRIIIPSRLIKQMVSFKALAFEYGQFRTISKWDCIDKACNEIPWYTYPAIEYLNNINFSDKVVFEYGSGNSSIYWGRRAKEVISVEDDKGWYDKVKINLGGNQKLLLKKKNSEYENAILNFGKKFDVIVIDGIRRVECARVISKVLNFDAPDGCMVILDNSDWYKGTSKYIRDELDLIEIDFHGFGPINSYTWTTSLFLSRNFNFQAIDSIQPNFSISAIRNNRE